MLIKTHFRGKEYSADLSKPLDISIPINEGDNNPNCYYARDVSFTTIRSGNFIGSVKEGGSVNYQEITITPHGNGTHTETYGHLSSDEGATITSLIKQFHCVGQLISVAPHLFPSEDQIILCDTIKGIIRPGIEALIVRTLPNNDEKKIKKYSGTNPPYLEAKLTQYLRDQGIKHLLVDLPSVDKEVDGGALAAHKSFWGLPNDVRKECTITELTFVDNRIEDGLYLLNLQTLNIAVDASPSRPVIYKLDLI